MRKTINTLALLYFIWLVLDAFNVFNILLNFLIAGEIPIVKIVLPPNLMLSLMAVTASVIVFETIARRFDLIRRVRSNAIGIITKRSRLSRIF